MESEGEDGMRIRYMPVMSMCIVRSRDDRLLRQNYQYSRIAVDRFRCLSGIVYSRLPFFRTNDLSGFKS